MKQHFANSNTTSYMGTNFDIHNVVLKMAWTGNFSARREKVMGVGMALNKRSYPKIMEVWGTHINRTRREPVVGCGTLRCSFSKDNKKKKTIQERKVERKTTRRGKRIKGRINGPWINISSSPTFDRCSSGQNPCL